MADTALITRRAAFTGALVSAAALAIPVAAAVTEERATPEEQIDHHMVEAAKAMNRVKPGLYYVMYDPSVDMLIIHRREASDGRSGIVHQYASRSIPGV